MSLHNFSQLRAQRTSAVPRFTEVTPPSNCDRAWSIRSNRGWHVLTERQSHHRNRTIYPAVVQQGEGLFICAAVVHLLDGNIWAEPDMRIGRKGYYELDQALARRIADKASYCSDGFCRSSSAHVNHDSIDIGLWLMDLVGSPLEGGWDALVKSWEAERPANLAGT